MKEQVTQWYAGRVTANLQKGHKETDDHKETADVRISGMKPIHARWIMSALDRVAKDIAGITHGWRMTGLLSNPTLL